MPTRFASSFSARKIAHNRGGRLAGVLLALLLTGFVVGTPAQERHKKPTHAGSADLPFEPVDFQEAAAVMAAVTHDFTTSDLSTAIHNTTEIKVPATGTAGIAAPYPLSTVISGFQGKVGRMAVVLNNLSHSCPNDLIILLVGPQGQKVVLMVFAGGCEPVDSVYLTFQDGSPKISGVVTSGAYAPTANGIDPAAPPAPGLPYSTSLSSFNNSDPNGTWSLFVYDQALHDVGTLSGFTLIISPQLSNNVPLLIPDCPVLCPPGTGTTVESPINFSGLTGIVTKATVSFHVAHTFDADLDIALVGPDNTTIPLVEDVGASGDNFGTSCANPTVLDDDATTAIGTGVAPFAGTYRPQTSLLAFFGNAPNGTWKLRIKDDAGADVGTLQCWSLTLTVHDYQTLQAPTRLRVGSIAGNEVTLRWTDPYDGPSPTNYVLEGGLHPGETLASIATNSFWPIHTFVAPTGSFYVRVRAQAGDQLGPPSNEIPLHVNVPLPPSPPGVFLGMADGSNVVLTWRNTFEGGAPSSLVLEVSGDANASIPLPLTESIAFAGVPSGNYNLRLRAANSAGVSEPALNARDGAGPSADPLRLTFPDQCSGAPSRPTGFLAHRSGNTISVVWEPPIDGWAPTEYVLNVGGSVVGSVTTTARALKGAVGPGTYHLSVAAKNACGVSVGTPVHHVIVP